MGVPATTPGRVALVFSGLLLMGASALPERLPRSKWARLLVGMAVVFLGFVAAQDFLRPGISHGHDVSFHAWGLWSTWRCVLDGDFYPRWNPYLSLGIPLLQFYSPLGYLAAWPAQAAGASPVQSLAWLMVLGQVATGASTYAAVRWAGFSRAAGLVAAVALVLAPYHLLDQTFRVALAETLAIPILPLFFVAVWKVARGERGRAGLILGLSAALLLLVHVLSLVMASFVAALIVLVSLFRSQPRGASRARRLGGLLLTVVLAAGATTAYWLPVVTEVGATSVSRISPPGRAISPYAVDPLEPIQRRAWERYGVRKKLTDSADPGASMPLYFGCVLLALTLAAGFRPRSSEDDERPDPRLWSLLALLSLALTLAPCARLLDGLPLLGRIMFPWRLYGPASVLAALAVGCALDRFLPSSGWPRRRLAILALTFAALGWDSAPYLGAAARLPDYEGQGLVAIQAGVAHPLDIPRDRFLRIEGVKMPPSDYGWRVAKSRRIFAEYMSPPLRSAYGKRTRPPTVQASENFHASYRVRRGRAEALRPKPYVRFRAEKGRYVGLAEVRWERSPEVIRVYLSGDLPAGNLRVTEAWFPGWVARADDQPWTRALRSKHLLAVSIPAGARMVEFRYSMTQPWDRPVGLAVSVAVSCSLLGLWWRRRRAVNGSLGDQVELAASRLDQGTN